MTCKRKFQKSTLYAYTQASQNIGVNAPINFNSKQKTGCSIELEGTNAVEIENPGLYLVEFNAVGSTQGTAGDIAVQLQKNGVDVLGAIASESSSTTTDIGSISFSTIIDVLPSCCSVDNSVNLSVVNTGVAATYTNVAINVIKLA